MSQKPRQYERGQSGVAALVIFSTLVIVGAIGAGALITTATALDVTAMATGTDSIDQLSDRVEYVDATGETGETTVVTGLTIEIAEGESVDSDGETRSIAIDETSLAGTNLTDTETTVGGGIAIATDEINATGANVTAVDGDRVDATVLATRDRTVTTVERLRLRVTGAPGADAVDATAGTVEYTSDRTHETLRHADEAGDRTFATAAVVGDDAVIAESGDRVEIELDAAAIRGALVLEDDGGTLRATDEALGVPAGDRVSVTYVTDGGATTEYRVSAPDVLHTEIVRI